METLTKMKETITTTDKIGPKRMLYITNDTQFAMRSPPWLFTAPMDRHYDHSYVQVVKLFQLWPTVHLRNGEEKNANSWRKKQPTSKCYNLHHEILHISPSARVETRFLYDIPQ